MLTATANRTDIQVLRGIAVGLVVAYHAHIPPFAGGYLGVDVFFVISGYLITRLIARDVEHGCFSLTKFYGRRAWRLLPAAYVTLAACAGMAPFLLTSVELRDFAKQLVGAVAFAGNVALWLQSGYFAQQADVKPLLHVWSLAVEEQFYLFLPAILLLTPRRRWSLLIVLGTLVSMALCVTLIASRPAATFFWLPTRAWELGMGSVAALLTVRGSPTIRGKYVLSCLSLLAIAALSIRPISATHPGLDAVLISIATAWLLVVPLRIKSDVFPVRLGAVVGDMSYSLYLVHWPIFAFINSANVSPAGQRWPLRLAALVVAMLLAALLHYGIEKRFRLHGPDRGVVRSSWWLVASAALLVAAALFCYSIAASGTNSANRLGGESGISESCPQSTDQMWGSECSNVSDPVVAVWGDSHGMQFARGLASEADAKVIQMARQACAPILGVAMFAPPERSRQWAESCAAFNDAALRGLSDSRQIETVVLVSRWDQVIERPVLLNGNLARGSIETIVAQLSKTILAIRAAGKKVILVEPPPWTGFDIGRCWLRQQEKKMSIGASSDCRISVPANDQMRAKVSDVLVRTQEVTGVEVFSYRPLLCGKEWCEIAWGDLPLYRDSNHLSPEGTAAISRKFGIYSQMRQRAN